MAGAAVEAGATAVMDFSLTVGALSISLKIDNVWIAGAVALGTFSLGALYLTRPVPTENAIRRGLERNNLGVVDPEVMNIANGSILVELHCHTETSFLLFLEDFEKNTVKFRLEEEFKKIGFKDDLDVTISNAEEVYKKARQIRNKMATSVDETDQLAEHLECSVCFERFQEPKVLKCQHMYCKKCLERLVTRIGQGRYAITCPECRETTEVSNGDVMSLPSNYVINRLLSKRSISKPSCEKHKGEIFKLFCQTCDELICRDCIVIDHRDHKYSFIEDIFPAEKEKIIKLVEESKVNIRTLKSSIETLKEKEESANKNFLEVRQKLDSFIDKQIELLEKKRHSMIDELQKLVLGQKNHIHEQMGTFVSSLDYLKNNTKSIEQNLSKGSEVDVLSTKNEMIQQLTQINSATANLKPRGRISYDLEADPPLNENTVGKIAKIRQYDEEYKLTIAPNAVMHFLGFRKEQEALESKGLLKSKFYIRPKSKTRFSPDNKVQVNIKSPKSSKVFSPVINNEQDGSFSFSYQPGMLGDNKIEIIINGRYMQGSPFTWEVHN